MNNKIMRLAIAWLIAYLTLRTSRVILVPMLSATRSIHSAGSTAATPFCVREAIRRIRSYCSMKYGHAYWAGLCGAVFCSRNASVDCQLSSHELNAASNRLKCLQAHYRVCARQQGVTVLAAYAKEIAYRLWVAVGELAAELDWSTADDAAALAMQLAGPSVAPSGPLFKNLCRLSPNIAIRVREGLIRIVKP